MMSAKRELLLDRVLEPLLFADIEMESNLRWRIRASRDLRYFVEWLSGFYEWERRSREAIRQRATDPVAALAAFDKVVYREKWRIGISTLPEQPIDQFFEVL